MSSTGAIFLGARAATAAEATITGAGGRMTELVVSLDGFCKSSASTLAVDVQPARHSDAIKKLMARDIRIWTCTQTQQTEGKTTAYGQTRSSYEREITNKV